MKTNQYLLPCGRVVFVKVYKPTDMLVPSLQKLLLKHKAELSKFVNPDHVGRKKKEWCELTYGKFVTLLIKKLMLHLLESDRIETEKGRFWCIGHTGEHPKFMNWHTDGKVYGVKVTGMKTRHRIKLSSKIGKELQKRILTGQKFHG